MIPYYVSSTKTKKSIQIIQNKVLRTIYKPPLKTKSSTIHKIANISTIDDKLVKLIQKWLNKAKDNPTIQDVIDEYNLLDQKSHRAAHLSVLNQLSVLE